MSIATSSGAGQVTTVAPVSGVAVGAGELWAPFKDLQELIERTVVNASPENIAELSEALKIHKPDFVSLLSTKPKSQADRDELKKGATEGIYLRGHESKKILQASIIQEALIMSDMFDINEFQALDLLTVAEAEQECHPGWGRGLLAVFMFYEGRAAMVSSFVSLLEAVPGFTWSSRVPKKVIELFQNFLNQVFQEDMVDRILALLSKYKLKQQIELLDTNLALGDWRHRASVIKFIEKIREGLGQIVFCWAAQRGLEWKDALRILDYLKTRWVLSDEFELEREDVLLITSLLYALDYSSSPQHLNRKFALELKKYCTENNFSNGFQCEEVLDLLKLAYFTDTYKLISETHVTTNTYQVDPAIADISEEDEFEFRKDMFNFLKSYLFCKRELFAEEEHVMRRFHAFFTDFITFLPLKVKDLKNRCEDTAKTIHLYSEQGLAHPPNLPRDYEHFLECMSLFYLEDELNLSSDYFSSELQYAYLNKFVRSATVDHPFMFIHNVKMLTGLAKGCSSGVFNLLKQNGHSLSLEHFFDSIIKYLGSFGSQVAFNGPSVYQSDTYQRVINDSMKFTVNPVEIVGICTYLDLIQVLCSSCTNVQHFFTTTKPHWLKVAVTAAKVRSIPREIRAKMLNAAAAMIARDSVGAETALNLWEMFYSVRLIDYGSGDLRDELEDRESRLESYSLTIGLLRLIDSLIDARFGVSDVSPLELNLNAQIDNGVLQPYVSFVRDSVLLKVGYRAYKSISERWELATLAMGILSKLLDYVPALMLQMLSDSPLHRMVLGALVDCMRLKEMSIGWAPHVDKCSQQCLQLIQRVLYRQHGFLYRRELSSGRQGTVVVGLHQLIMKVLPDTGKPDYLLSVVKFIDLMYPRLHRDTALDILVMILDGHGETDSHVYSTVTSESSVAAILRQTLCEFLDEPGTEGRVKNLVLQLVRSSVVHPSPNVALYLLGADKKVDFQNPGVQNYPRNVLHAILDNAVATPDAFLTLLILMRDSRLSASLLRYLRTNQYFVKILVKEFPAPNMETQCVGYFLKCVALELNHTKQPGPLAHVLVGQERGKFQEILEKIEMQLQTLEIPSLEFFDPALVIQAMKTCEYHDRELNTKIVRVDVLETLLRDEIAKLEKSTVLRLRKSVHNEAKELISFAKQLNAARTREASKVLMFDGWKQCLEILLLNPAALKLAGVDFVTSILRLILDKVRSTQGPSEYFLRLAAETTLTLCAVMRKLQAELKGPTLNVILNHLCSWVPDEQHAGVRTYLYASIHYVVDMIREVEGATTNQASFAQIIDHLCRDVSQASDFGRLQAMYLMGEIIRWTHSRNLGGYEIARVPSSPAVATPSRSALRPRETLIPGTPLSFREAGPNLSAVFSRPSPAASRSLLETTPSGRGGLKTPVRSKAVASQGFGDSPGAQGGFNMSQGFNVSGSQGAFGASPGGQGFNASGQGFNVSGLQRSFASQSLSRSRLEDKENRSDSEDEEGDGDARHKSILDCTSQDIFDTSRAQAKDEGLGKVTTSRRLALGSSASKKEFEKASAMSSSQSILINHMHTKGYLRALVDALPIVDDPLLMQLFSERPDANRMRALLLFEGKMSLFSRMAWAGMQPTLYLVDVNTILRLADMSVFDINFLDEQDKAAIATRDEMSMSLASDFGGRGVPIPSRRARMETLFSSFLRFFIAMVTSAPKNVLIIDQIWHFITVHDYALATLISASVIHEDEYRSSAYMFTALMAKIAKRLHGNSFKIVRNKATVYTRMIGILKQQGMEHVSTENRLALVLNAMLFLYNHAFNVEAMKEEDGAKRSGRPCRVVLTRQLNLMSPKGNQDHEVPLGLVLKLARDSLHRIHVSTNISVSAKAAQCHASIAEIGLTLAYHHAEMFSRDPSLGAVEFGAGEIEQRNFQQELRSTVEEYFAIDLGLHAEPIPGNYTEVMLHRLRRLAHMPS